MVVCLAQAAWKTRVFVISDDFCAEEHYGGCNCYLLGCVCDRCSSEMFAGEFQIGDNITPLDPNSVESVVYYGVLRSGRSRQATGHSLIYNQLYPFEGRKNYTSGIIHHVRLKGIVCIVVLASVMFLNSSVEALIAFVRNILFGLFFLFRFLLKVDGRLLTKVNLKNMLNKSFSLVHYLRL